MPLPNLKFRPFRHPHRVRRLRLLAFTGLFLPVFGLSPPRIAAAEPAAKDFDVPAGDASSTLGQFVAQAGAGERVLYSAPEVAGVKTNAIRGRYTPFQAVDLMMTGTVLEALQVDETGAITIRRRPPPNRSQTVAPETDAQNQEEAGGARIVRMSQFEVTTTQGHGYVSTNAATAFKTNEALMDIPQVDIVVTNDFINDIGYENTTDVLQYFGVSSNFQGESDLVRGYRISYPYVDEMPQNAPFQDNAYIDSYEIIKGPTEALYLNTPLSGVVLKATKKPLPIDQDILTASINSWGLYRITADSTGPLGSIGDIKLGYRFVGVFQRGGSYFYNTNDNRTVLFPELQISYHNTLVRIYYNFQNILAANGIDLLTPTGLLYTAAGRKQVNQPPNNMDHYQQNETELEVLQKISETWENRLMGSYWRQSTLGPRIIPSKGFDWGTQTEYFTPSFDGQTYEYWSVLDDTSGHYNLGPPNWEMKNVDALGFSFSNPEIKTYSASPVSPFGNSVLLPGQPAGTLAVPANSSAAINAIVVPKSPAYGPNANYGTNQQTYLSAIYYQHATDLIPNWLTLSAAFTWDTIATETVANISSLPWNSISVPASQWLHRLAAVVHLTRAVSLYALDSTSFTPVTSGELANGQLPPSMLGKGTELGLKANLLGGRLSGEFAWFRLITTNVENTSAGVFPNGNPIVAIIGTTAQEGVDGDVSIALEPGLQLIGSFYAGHDRDVNGVPVTGSYDNQWGIFVRYAFNKESALRGLAIGAGGDKIGGRWISDGGELDAAAFLPPSIAGETPELKVVSRPLMNAFVSYALNKHWLFRLNGYNLLNEVYPVGVSHAYAVDAIPPTTFSFEAEFKF